MPRTLPSLSATLALAVLALAGCSENGGGIRELGRGASPDEFMVLPTRPLEMPTDLTALPPPTPGASNRVDYHPQAETVAMLGGSPVAGSPGAGPLVARVGPAAPNIRPVLATEDVTYRQEHRGRLLERLSAGDNRDGLIYRAMRLDAGREWEYQRAQGRQVPAAPPPPVEE